jgi:alkylation response protein AidB-like acyl-CoA dehydrogenase
LLLTRLSPQFLLKVDENPHELYRGGVTGGHEGPAPGDLEDFAAKARGWLQENAAPKPPGVIAPWGRGSDDVSVFHDLSQEQEWQLLRDCMAWQQCKYDAGYGAITWPEEHGGAALTDAHELAFKEIEQDFDVPGHHETFSVTLHLVAPTVRVFGTAAQQRRWIPRFLRTSELCCQLFSEPGAGSDLASVATRAVRDGDGWVISGQKVWSSGARFSHWGEIICRTDPTVPKHAGMTAFVLPMDASGVTMAPIRQMSGGASFNEVFLDEVRVPDSARLGDVGAGWKVALTTLGFERRNSSASGGASTVGGSWEQLLGLARWLGVTDDRLVRQRLASLYTRHELRRLTSLRFEASQREIASPGPEGSVSKLLWTQWLTEVGDTAAALLGPRIFADSGEWGTFAWSKHLLGAPGYRIAGGSDEIQRNICADRLLRLPPEPRLDREVPFNQVPR